jgi:hypothetical protein
MTKPKLAKCDGYTLKGNSCSRYAYVNGRCPDHGGKWCEACGQNPVMRRDREPTRYFLRTEEYHPFCQQCAALMPAANRIAEEAAEIANRLVTEALQREGIPDRLGRGVMPSTVDASELWGY